MTWLGPGGLVSPVRAWAVLRTGAGGLRQPAGMCRPSGLKTKMGIRTAMLQAVSRAKGLLASSTTRTLPE